MRVLAALITATFLGSALRVQAQESKEPSGPAAYKVEFDIRNGSDGESQPNQHFSMLIYESRKGIFQAASRDAVATASPHYVDVGVSIECTVYESDGKVFLRGAIETTSIAGHVNLSAMSQLIIGQRKMAFNTAAELGTPTVITDDLNALAVHPIPLNRTAAPASGIQTKPPPVDAVHQVEATVTKTKMN
jgi:hypothetical protein